MNPTVKWVGIGVGVIGASLILKKMMEGIDPQRLGTGVPPLALTGPSSGLSDMAPALVGAMPPAQECVSAFLSMAVTEQSDILSTLYGDLIHGRLSSAGLDQAVTEDQDVMSLAHISVWLYNFNPELPGARSAVDIIKSIADRLTRAGNVNGGKALVDRFCDLVRSKTGMSVAGKPQALLAASNDKASTQGREENKAPSASTSVSRQRLRDGFAMCRSIFMSLPWSVKRDVAQKTSFRFPDSTYWRDLVLLIQRAAAVKGEAQRQMTDELIERLGRADDQQSPYNITTMIEFFCKSVDEARTAIVDEQRTAPSSSDKAIVVGSNSSANNAKTVISGTVKTSSKRLVSRRK